MKLYPDRVEMFGISIDPFTMDETVQKTKDFISRNQFAHLIGVNADKVLQVIDDSEMRSIVNRCELINADGASMIMAANRLGVPIPERVAGIDLMLELCGMAEKEGLPIYLLGAKPEIVEQTEKELQKRFPRLMVAGIHDGYFDEHSYDEISSTIEKSSAKIIFVGITSPKKEHVIESFRKLGSTKVYVGVGGSFDVISGELKRAPEWMQNHSLEWLYRMFQEPGRLLKRYFVGNTRFMLLLRREMKKIG